MNIMAGSLGGRFPDLSSNRLEVLSVLINDICNLHCQHCYLNSHSERHLQFEEWLRFFSSVFSDLAPSVLCIAGQEPLVDAESVALWSAAIGLRDRLQPPESRQTAIGLITNGTLVERHGDAILAAPPDYIDVSIDGLPESHDRIRGPGAFAVLAPNLRWLTAKLPKRVWVTHTLFGSNIDELPSFVEFLHHEFGLSRFALGLYRDLPHGEPSLSLRGHLLRFGEAIEGLGGITIKGSVQVILDLGYDQGAEAEALQRLEWEPPTRGGSSDLRLLCNGLVLRINSISIPTGLWHSVRVSSGGYWLAAEDLLVPADYAKRAVTNLRSCDYDTRRAYEIGLRHPRLDELVALASRTPRAVCSGMVSETQSRVPKDMAA